MYAAERHQAILERAREHGRVDVQGLAADLAVTPETVRRDLSTLESQGLVRRVHGGAIPVERLGVESAVAVREGLLGTEKARIAKAALAELPLAGTILLDAGTTTVRLAQALPTDRPLSVVTHSLPVATLLAARPNVTLHLVGGTVRGRTLAAVGPWALRELAEVQVDVAFLGTNGLTVERGLTTPDLAEAAVKRALAASARRVVVLADRTKLGHDDFARVIGIEDVDAVITDTDADEGLVRRLRDAGPRVELA